MANFFDNGGFFWWTGVVEDRNDPLFLGRCKVRIVGYHSSDTTVLPTEDLPWATVVQPITSAAMTGIGQTPLGLVEGTWVLGFFADGKDNQEPMVLGALGGIPQSAYYNSVPKTQGFQDATKTYPVTELLDEPDTNRLARGIRTTFVDDKDSRRSKNIPLSRDNGTWNEPKSPFAAKYPFNHVRATESGHIQEFDDTPDAERLHTYHKAGTFTEVDRNGTRATHIIGDNYEVLERNGYLYIKGKMNVTIDGSSNVYVKNNCNLQVDGSLLTDVHGDYTLNVAGDIKVSGGKTFQMRAKKGVKLRGKGVDIKSDSSINMLAKTSIGLKAGMSMYLEAASKFAIKAVTAAVDAVFQQKNMTVSTPSVEATTALASAAVGTAGNPSVPAAVESKSPTEPTFSNLGFVLSEAQKKSFKIEAFKAQEAAKDTKMVPAGRQVAQEYADLKTEELSSNAVVSAPVIPEDTATETTPVDYTCEVGMRVVEFAKQDIGVLETSTPPGKNYGGKRGGGALPVGEFGRIDEMLEIAGLDNKAEVRRKGEGFYWCAAAVTAWWKAAGLPVPVGPASCRNWESWGRKNGYFSSTPKIGAAVLYGPSGAAHHIGIVSAVDADGNITTIEGNTSGGGFTRNGCGVFYKTPRSYIGFIIPPTCS